MTGSIHQVLVHSRLGVHGKHRASSRVDIGLLFGERNLPETYRGKAYLHVGPPCARIACTDLPWASSVWCPANSTSAKRSLSPGA